MSRLIIESGTWNRAVWLRLHEMRKAGSLCDTEMVLDSGETLLAHKCILAAASPFMKQLLLDFQEPNTKPVFKIPDMHRPVIEAILEFVYTGAFKLEFNYFDELKNAAKTFQMAELSRLCELVESQEQEVAVGDAIVMLESTQWNRGIWNALNAFRRDNKFCNVLLSTQDGATTAVHGCVLMAASTHFSKHLHKLKQDPTEMMQLELPMDYQQQHLQTGLDFIYTGNFICQESNFTRLFKMAELLHLEEMKKFLLGFQSKHNIDPENEAKVVTIKEVQIVEEPSVDESQVQDVDDQDANDAEAEEVEAPSMYADPQVIQAIYDANKGEYIYRVGGGSGAETGDEGPQLVETSAESAPADVLEVIQHYDSITASQQQAAPGTTETQLPVINDGPRIVGFAKQGDTLKLSSLNQLPEVVVNINGKNAASCPVCHKIFRKPYEVRKHMMKHTGERPFVCQVCKRGFKFKTNLISHEKIHRGVKPHKCPLCPQRFIRPSDLVSHKRIHTKEKPFKCNYCEKAFSQQSNCHTHMVNVHLSSKKTYSDNMFECLQCGKHVKTAKALKRHEKIHQENRPTFSCELCGTKFLTKIAQMRHVRLRRCENEDYDFVDQVKDVGYECSKCNKALTYKGFRKHVEEGCSGALPLQHNIKTEAPDDQEEDDGEEEALLYATYLKCIFCSEVTKSTPKLKLHLENCASLPENFDIDEHIRAVRDPDSQVGRESRVSVPKQQLQRDYGTSHGVSFKPGVRRISEFKCLFCGLCVSSLYVLTRHLKLNRCKNKPRDLDEEAYLAEIRDPQSEKGRQCRVKKLGKKKRSGEKVNCTFCKKEYFKMSDLKLHIVTKKCKWLPETVDLDKALEEIELNAITDHKKEFSNANNISGKYPGAPYYECKYCRAKFTVLWGLKKHCLYKRCKMWPADVDIHSYLEKLGEHDSEERAAVTKKSEDDILFACGKKNCIETFTSIVKLRQHKGKCRGGPKTFPCQVCNKPLYSKETLKSHIIKSHLTRVETLDMTEDRSKENNEQTPEATPLAGTDHQYTLDEKSRAVMLGRGVYQCSDCPELFTSPLVYQQHYVDVHQPAATLPTQTQQQPQCKFCNAQFSGVDELVEHVLETHSRKDTTATMEHEADKTNPGDEEYMDLSEGQEIFLSKNPKIEILEEVDSQSRDLYIPGHIIHDIDSSATSEPHRIEISGNQMIVSDGHELEISRNAIEVPIPVFQISDYKCE